VPEPQHSLQLEVIPELFGNEREHRVPQSASRQQIGALGLELARARAQKDEPQPFLLDEAVRFVQERWNSLDLVDDDLASVGNGSKLTGEQAGISQQILIERLVE